MVDNNRDWTPEKSYENYPQGKWCDLDYIADWIYKQNYEPVTNIKNLTEMIWDFYYSEDFADGYFAIKDTRGFPDNLMVNITDVEAYVIASGGLTAFDYYE